MNYFANAVPSFISVRGDQFAYDHTHTVTLRVMIQKVQPVRKHFKDGKLTCYSMDALIAMQSGKYCVFCDDKFRCQKKLRLSMLDITQSQFQPLILDINQTSFESLENFIQNVGDDRLHATPVGLKIVYDEHDRRSIDFTE